MVIPRSVRDPCTEQATGLMEAFAHRTGITSGEPPRRYLWTDAFAVCNCIAFGSKNSALVLRRSA